MKTLRASFLLSVLLPAAALAAGRVYELRADLRADNPDFSKTVPARTTPLFRLYVTENRKPYTAVSNWTGVMYFSTNDTALQGMVITNTATGTHYLDFRLTADNTASTGTYFAQFGFYGPDSEIEELLRGELIIEGAGVLGPITAWSWNWTNEYPEADPIWASVSNLYYLAAEIRAREIALSNALRAFTVAATGGLVAASGDITGVYSGTGLVGSASSGNATLHVDRAWFDNLYATGTPVYAESDPDFVAASNNFLLRNGSKAMTGDLNMGNGTIVNVIGGIWPGNALEGGLNLYYHWYADVANVQSVNFTNRSLRDTSGVIAIDWKNRYATDSLGFRVFGWSDGGLNNVRGTLRQNGTNVTLEGHTHTWGAISDGSTVSQNVYNAGFNASSNLIQAGTVPQAKFTLADPNGTNWTFFMVWALGTNYFGSVAEGAAVTNLIPFRVD